ncbi:MAG: dienelactone hydrolase family protein [Ktedonobacteraceae bacterium]
MVQTETVSFSSGNLQLNGYLAYPEGEGPFPGVIVIHEIYGLNDNIRDIARRFADEGYAALAVDLFTSRSRAVCMARFMGQIMFNPLNNGSIHHLKSALSYLAEQPRVDANRVGAIGFCMGGSFVITWACTDDRLKAIAPFYGMNPRPLSAVQRLCPVVGSYPEQDFTRSHGQRLAVALDEYHVPHDIKVYPNAKHSFFNDQGGSYNAAAAQDSWQRILGYFQEHLGHS